MIEILYQYVELREEERNGWNGKAQLNGMVSDYENIKERYYEQHKEEIDTYRNAVRFLKANHGSLEVKKNAFDEEIKKRKASDQKNQEGLEFLKTDLQELRQVRYFVDKVLVNEAEKQKSKSIHERLEEKKQKKYSKKKKEIFGNLKNDRVFIIRKVFLCRFYKKF